MRNQATGDAGVLPPQLRKQALAEVEALTERLGARDDLADLLNQRGLAHLALGEVAAAIRDFDGAIALHPEHAHAYNNRGFAKLILGNSAEAREDCAKAVGLDGSISRQNLELALQHVQMVERRAQLSALIQREPATMAQLHNERGLIKLALEGAQAARVDFEQAVSLDPGNAHLHNNLSFAALASHDLDAAERHYRMAAQLDASISSENLRAIQRLRRANQGDGQKEGGGSAK